MSSLCTFNVRPDILVNFCNWVRHKQLKKNGLFPSFRSNSEIDNISWFDLILFYVCFRANWLVTIKLANINLLSFLESFLKLFSDWNQFSIFNLVLRELIEELLFGHRSRAIYIKNGFELWIVFHLRVISFVTHIYRFQRHSFWILFLQIVWEVSIQDITQHTLKVMCSRTCLYLPKLALNSKGRTKIL